MPRQGTRRRHADATVEGKRYDEYPDFLTRIEQLRPELNTFAVADWMPLVSSEGGGPVISDSVDEKDILDGYELGWPEADARSVELAVDRRPSGLWPISAFPPTRRGTSTATLSA